VSWIKNENLEHQGRMQDHPGAGRPEQRLPGRARRREHPRRQQSGWLLGKTGPAPRLRCPPCRPDILVDDELSLADFGFNARIVYTPGHSPGSQSVIVDGEIALVGDAMFGIVPGSAFPPFASDVPLLVDSWGKLLVTGCRLFLPAHGTANSRLLVQRDFDKFRGVAKT
jgi:glyoxylase-like metal-dependent hydrolase (beta-lactamase superfamily II)